MSHIVHSIELNNKSINIIAFTLHSIYSSVVYWKCLTMALMWIFADFVVVKMKTVNRWMMKIMQSFLQKYEQHFQHWWAHFNWNNFSWRLNNDWVFTEFLNIRFFFFFDFRFVMMIHYLKRFAFNVNKMLMCFIVNSNVFESWKRNGVNKFVKQIQHIHTYNFMIILP